jgi:uncharacterized membrane protein YfcA
MLGGGALIQIPALLLLFPQFAPATVLGTNKLISISGTTVAAWQYARGGHLHWRSLRTPFWQRLQAQRRERGWRGI